MGNWVRVEGRYLEAVVLLWPHPRNQKQTDVSGQSSLAGNRDRESQGGIPRQQKARQWQSCPWHQEEKRNQGPMGKRQGSDREQGTRRAQSRRTPKWSGSQSCGKHRQWGQAPPVKTDGFQNCQAGWVSSEAVCRSIFDSCPQSSGLRSG